MSLSEQERLDAALGQLPPAQVRSMNDEDRRAVESLREWLMGLRESASASARSEAPLVESILARTTREDLSWRGDVRVWREFLERRLRRSPALRVAAALLMVQLLLAPGVLAFLVLRPAPERPEVRLGIEPASPADAWLAEDEELMSYLPSLEEPSLVPPGSLEVRRAQALQLVGISCAVSGQGPLARAVEWRFDGLAEPEEAAELMNSAALDLGVRAVLLEGVIDRACRGSLVLDAESLLGEIVGLPDLREGSVRAAALWRRAQGRAQRLGLLPGSGSGGVALDLGSWAREVEELARERGSALAIRIEG